MTEGRAEGRAEGMAEAVRTLMTSLSMDAEQAMDVLRIPRDERSRYREALV